jgi:hypothetical protein
MKLKREIAREGAAMTPKVSEASLRYLESYARIAIQISKISREKGNWRGARAIKLRLSGELR